VPSGGKQSLRSRICHRGNLSIRSIDCERLRDGNSLCTLTAQRFNLRARLAAISGTRECEPRFERNARRQLQLRKAHLQAR